MVRHHMEVNLRAVQQAHYIGMNIVYMTTFQDITDLHY